MGISHVVRQCVVGRGPGLAWCGCCVLHHGSKRRHAGGQWHRQAHALCGAVSGQRVLTHLCWKDVWVGMGWWSAIAWRGLFAWDFEGLVVAVLSINSVSLLAACEW